MSPQFVHWQVFERRLRGVLREWGERGRWRVAIVCDIDELRGHPRIDIHLGVSHVCNQFNAHPLHLVMDQVAGSIARVCSENNLGRSLMLYSIHHVQSLHLQSLRDLKRNETVVIGLIRSINSSSSKSCRSMSMESPQPAVQPLIDESTLRV